MVKTLLYSVKLCVKVKHSSYLRGVTQEKLRKPDQAAVSVGKPTLQCFLRV